jgi:hypothetical protein
MADNAISRIRHAELVSASILKPRPKCHEAKWTLKQVQGDGVGFGKTQ